MVIPFVEYLAGRRIGWYPPNPRPSFKPVQKDLQEEMKEEVRKVFIRRIAEQTLPPVGDPRYAACVKDLKNCFYDPNTGQYEVF